MLHPSLLPSLPPSPPPNRLSVLLIPPLLDCGCLRGCFSLRLPLMKGRTKLPSLCPCVVGRFTSLLSPSFPLLPSVSSPPSALHVSRELVGRPAGRPLRLGRLTMWGVFRGVAGFCVYICAYRIEHACCVLSTVCEGGKNVRASGFSFPSLSSVFGSFFNCRGG